MKSVTILYRRTRSEMPAFRDEIDEAVNEGVEIVPLVAPLEVNVKGKDGKLSGVTLIRNSLGPVDASGRRSPAPIKGSEYKLALDTLIVAAGEETAAAELLGRAVNLSAGCVAANPSTCMTSMRGVFAGGDASRGPGTVVNALADGRNAAECMDRFLAGGNPAREFRPSMPSVHVEAAPRPDRDEEAPPRAKPKTLSLKQRLGGFKEVEKALSEADARREAGRCLRCDLEFPGSGEDEEVCNAVGTEKS